ncbi:hypothetical protein EDB87DRAFT_1684151 [Lactarius vividus]|nr:hypothetical protein EDB87DRAFT_1684151 [Lactarius vividus]
MANHRVPSQANHLSGNSFPPPLRQPNAHVQQYVADHYVPVADDDQQVIHREGIPQPTGDVHVAMHGQMQYPHHVDALHYNAAQYHPPPGPPPYPEVPYMHMHRNVGAAQDVPLHAHAFAPVPEVQVNHAGLFGYGAQFHAADPPETFPVVWPQPAPLADITPPNGLRNLAGHYLHNPDTHVNMVWIEPGPGGGFKVWIALELPNIF